MIKLGKLPKEKIELYSFSQTAKILQIKYEEQILGRTGMMKILRTCNVLNYYNEPYIHFQELGVLKYWEKIHTSGTQQRRDSVTLVVGQKGLDFVREVVTNYLRTGSIPFDPPPNPYSGQMYIG